MSAAPLVQVENVSVSFSAAVILEKISFNVFPGEVIAIIGLNGAGKTTLLKTILGIHKPSKGSVTVHARRTGYVPQSLAFDRSIPLTVRELLQSYHGKRAGIEEKLVLTGGGHLLSKKIGDVSGGELQRVMLANALLAEPELLLLDEPTTGVDVVGEKNFFDIIKGLQDTQKMAIVLVSHDIHLVYRHATRIICINKTMMCQGPPGELAGNGALKELFGGHLTPYEHGHD